MRFDVVAIEAQHVEWNPRARLKRRRLYILVFLTIFT